jgi:adenosine deaminase
MYVNLHNSWLLYLDAITRAVYEIAEDAQKDGVQYLEIRFSPVLHTQEGLGLSQVMEAVCEGQAMAELNLPILVRIIGTTSVRIIVSTCSVRHETIRSFYHAEIS